MTLCIDLSIKMNSNRATSFLRKQESNNNNENDVRFRFKNGMTSVALVNTIFFLVFFSWIRNLSGQHTRSYFQQTVNYDIQVSLDEINHELNGYEEIEYINKSHHGMDTIWFHLWPNAYKNNETALGKQLLENGDTKFQFLNNEKRGFIDSLDFKVNGEKITLIYHPKWEDVCALVLNKKLAPNERLTITTPFKVKIPQAGISRLGHDKNAYQITQWYPKPAVFDKNGWHAMPYLNQGEFYSEYGTFDVRITVPKNYIVAATGELKTKSELNFLDSLSNIDYSENSEVIFDTSISSVSKTLHYRQTNVHDFAWFTQKDFLVRKDSVRVPNSGRKVTTWAFFAQESFKEWKEVPTYINQAVDLYSKYTGDYPYNHCTAVEASLEAGGGMEYPMITIIDFGMTGKLLETVVVHEVGHNWFYGQLGFNERAIPALDEGINSFYEMRYFEEFYGDSSLSAQVNFVPKPIKNWLNLNEVTTRGEKYLTYLFTARNNTDQKLTEHADHYTNLNYGAIVYAKMAVSMQMLRDALGTEIYDQAMREYYAIWEFKHPDLNDLKQVFESVSKQDLTWFFDHYLNTTEKLNVKIKRVKTKGNIHQVTVKNKSSVNLPVKVHSLDKNGKVLSMHQIKSLTGKSKIELSNEGGKYVKVDANLNMVENNRKDNLSRTGGLLKKVEPIQLKFLSSLENPNKTQLFYLPTIGWNSSDQTMLGIGLHNKSILEKPFEFYLGPMYSFNRNSINGIADVNYHWYCENFIKRITLNSNVQRFSYANILYGENSTSFERYYPKIKFDFKNSRARSPIKNSLQLGSIYSSEQTSRTGLPIVNEENLFAKVEWQTRIKKTLSYSEINVNSTTYTDFQLFELEGIQHFKYKQGNKRIALRLYSGVFASNNTVSPRFNLRMDGQSGWYDYTFSSIFQERGTSHNVWAQQMNDNHGAFKTPTSVGQSNSWLIAFNIKSELPLPLPLGVYTDFGSSSSEAFLYNFGVYLPIINDIFEVYFPVAWSKSIDTAYQINGIGYGEQIRFTLHLNKLNPFRAIDWIVE